MNRGANDFRIRAKSSATLHSLNKKGWQQMSDMPMTVWVLICDASRAMFFQVRDGEPAWHLVNVVSRSESSSGAADSSSEVEDERFARSLGQAMDRGLRASRFRRWVLVAPPLFVGLIKKGLTKELEKHLMATVDKDMVHAPLHTLSEDLRDAVRIPVDQRDAIRDAYRRAH